MEDYVMSTSRDWLEEFKWFHSHPEVGFREYETTIRIRQILQEEGIEEIPFPLETGALAVIRGTKPGNSRLLRADIDALPVKEESGLPYASVNEGRMHACGHDIHIVNGLMVASDLNGRRDEVEGTVYVLFQPGEEVVDGARSVIRSGITEGIDEFYAIHVDPASEAGMLGLKSGGITASVDRFHFTVTGESAHAAMPHQGNNPIHVLTDLAKWLDSYSDSKVNAFTSHVVTVARISAGNAWNVIPASGELEGTVRTYDEAARAVIKSEIEGAMRAFEKLYGVNISLDWWDGPHVTMNDEALYEKAKRVADRLGFPTKVPDDIMIGDDFGDYVTPESGKKSLYIRIGSGVGETYHHPRFCADPTMLHTTSRFMSELLLKDA